MVINTIKRFAMKTLFSKGKIIPIIKGPLKGYKYIVKHDTGFSSILGRWEKESQLVYLNSIFPGDTVFDLGANFGIHSMLYSKIVGERGKVYSFEPLPYNIRDLELHKKVNSISNIYIEQVAVSNTCGNTSFKIAAHGGQGSLIGIGCETGEILDVKTTTLDEFCTRNNVYPDFIKIDIEGAEGLAVEGFSKTVRKSYPFLSIDLHNINCDLAIGKFLKENGYEAYRVINCTARSLGKKGKQLEKINDLTSPYPEPGGIWGVIWAVHPSRKSKVQSFIDAYIK